VIILPDDYNRRRRRKRPHCAADSLKIAARVGNGFLRPQLFVDPMAQAD
jgi:hypothetical protein